MSGLGKIEAEMAHGENFGEWLKRARKELDLSQRDLSQQVSCALVTIQKIEAGRRRPSRELAGLLARSLTISPEETERFLKLARVTTPRLTERGEADPSPELIANLLMPTTEAASRLADHSLSLEPVSVGQRLEDYLPVADLTRLIKLYRLDAEALLVMGRQEAAGAALDLANSLEASARWHSRLISLLPPAGIPPPAIPFPRF